MINENIYYKVLSEFFSKRGFYTFVDYPVYGAGSVRVDVLAYSKHSNTIVSVEVKRRFMKRYILQLMSYMKFSDYVYLALPRDRFESMRRSSKETLNKLGIGIITVRQCSEISIELRAQRSPLLSEEHRKYVLRRLQKLCKGYED